MTDLGRATGSSNATNVSKFSASTSGAGINLTATSTPGTAIHTAAAGAVTLDRVWLYVTNTSASAVVVTVEFGGTTVGFRIVYSVPSQNTALVVPGLVINGGLSVAAFAGTGSVLNAIGYIEKVY